MTDCKQKNMLSLLIAFSVAIGCSRSEAPSVPNSTANRSTDLIPPPAAPLVQGDDKFDYKTYPLIEAALLAKCRQYDKLDNLLRTVPSERIVEMLKTANAEQEQAAVEIAKLAWESTPSMEPQRQQAIQFHEGAFDKLDNLRAKTEDTHTITLIMIRNIMKQHKKRIDSINAF